MYGATRDEANAKLVALMGEVARGLPVATTQDSVASYLRSWLEEVAAKRVRPNTLTSYRSNVKLHIVPVIGSRKLGKLSTRDVRSLLAACDASGLSPRSTRYVHATLRVALEDAVRDDLVPRNVAKLVRLSTPPRAETRVLTVDEARLLLSQTRTDRLHAALVVLLVLGLRRSEALGLRWSDIDFDASVLHVRQGLHWSEGRLQFLPPKTRRSRRTVPMPSVCLEALGRHRSRQAAEAEACLHPWPPVELVFTTTVGTPVDPNNFSRTFARWCRDAGVPAVRLHDLRHTCVSMLLTLGVNPRVVMEIVGHAALEMTMNVYAHVAVDEQRLALDKLDGLYV
ncbi:site-specific integrase [Aquipuribacter hungaricus]|uniref:Tyrosine recombinase XerC n=1 Tax=Aquipuribacter hungaricus TaxID=545624 RepID=A0ABV7WBT6_9MICO